MTAVPPIVLSVTDKYGGRSRIERAGGLKEYSIGRGYEADDPDPATILIPDAMVSPKHCSIQWDDVDSWILRDMGSVNGTVVGGEVLTSSHRLGDGSEFKIGGSIVRLNYGSDISDDAVPLLSLLTNIKELDIRETEISEEGVAQIRDALPACRIVSDYGTFGSD